jgi:ribosomal protein S27AE
MIKAWDARNPEKLKAYRAAWRARNSEKEKASRATWLKNNQEKRKATTTTWIKNNPEKYVAHNALNNALRDGKVTKLEECQQCGAGGRVQAHHADYAKPLEVKWLCGPCHVAEHAT